MSMRPSLTRQYIRQALLSGPALLSVSWALPAAAISPITYGRLFKAPWMMPMMQFSQMADLLIGIARLPAHRYKPVSSEQYRPQFRWCPWCRFWARCNRRPFRHSEHWSSMAPSNCSMPVVCHNRGSSPSVYIPQTRSSRTAATC